MLPKTSGAVVLGDTGKRQPKFCQTLSQIRNKDTLIEKLNFSTSVFQELSFDWKADKDSLKTFKNSYFEGKL